MLALLIGFQGDINLDSALAILARGAGQQRDPLAAREGGCRLQSLVMEVKTLEERFG